ncbi:unnamed protein product [Victoria cruziana]
MYKNQLQELAQRSCFNLPSYACIREGPDHAPRFRATVNFNGEIFEGPSYCTTLRQAEHAAAEVALSTLSTRGPPKSLAAKVLDETGVYKNLLQETAHRAGLNLPVYTTVRSGPGHLPVFTCTVELAGMSFNGDPARTKKQAEKNAAMTAWSSLKQLPNLSSFQISKEPVNGGEEQDQVIVAKALSDLSPKEENGKLARQREHHQNIARKRIMMNYRSKNAIHSQNSSHCRQWRSSDLLSETTPSPTMQQPQLQSQTQPQPPRSVFLGPPAPHCSKLLPPLYQQQQQQKLKESLSQSCTSLHDQPPSLAKQNQTRVLPVEIRSRPQAKLQEISTLLDEHQKDEEEWLNGEKKEVANSRTVETEANASGSATAFRPAANFCSHFPPLNLHLGQRTQETQMGSPTNFRTPPPPQSAIARRPPILHSRRFCGPDFPTHAMAPAVQIRSVIPVCAAPPAKPPPEQTQKQEPSCSDPQSIAEAASKMANLSV